MNIKYIFNKKIDSYNQKIVVTFIFCLSILMSYIFLIVERKFLGIGSTYHPDASHYLDLHHKYSYLSLKISLKENLYNYLKYFLSSSLFYSIIQLFYDLREIFTFSSPYRNIVKFNMLMFALTNLIILTAFFKNYKKNNKLNLSNLILITIFCFLPYKLHFSVNVLKETLVFFFLIIYVVYPSRLTLFISFFFGTPLRSSFGLYYLVLVEFNKKFLKKYFIFLIVFFIAIVIFYYKNIYVGFDNDFVKFMENRNIANMGGREYDNIPNFVDNELFGSIIRMIIWPAFFLSGIFVFFSDNYLFYIIGAEIILIHLIFFLLKKRLLINLGLIIFLCLVALYVNTFTSYVRYCYLAINIYFLKEIFKESYRN